MAPESPASRREPGRSPGHNPAGLPRPATGPSLLVVIPALDEEKTVAEVIRGVDRDLPGISSVDILVVSDGSTDRTADEARAAGAVVIQQPKTRGVGAAFAAALAYGIDAGVDLIVSIDADGQFDPADIPALIEPVLQGQADFASASRFADPALVPEMPRIKRWGNHLMARLVSRLAGQTFHDVSCGMRCYSRRAALSLNPMGDFTYTQEVFLNLAFKHMRIVEVPVRVRGEREFGESRVAGSLGRYALRTSSIIFRCYRDYNPMRLFGGIALLLILPALALGGFLALHYLSSGAFTPYKWTGFAAATLAGLGLIMLHMGMIGDMLNRHRHYLEELLYRQRERPSREPPGD